MKTTQSQIKEILGKYIRLSKDYKDSPIIIGFDRAIIELDCKGIVELEDK